MRSLANRVRPLAACLAAAAFMSGFSTSLLPAIEEPHETQAEFRGPVLEGDRDLADREDTDAGTLLSGTWFEIGQRTDRESFWIFANRAALDWMTNERSNRGQLSFLKLNNGVASPPTWEGALVEVSAGPADEPLRWQFFSLGPSSDLARTARPQSRAACLVCHLRSPGGAPSFVTGWRATKPPEQIELVLQEAGDRLRLTLRTRGPNP